MLVLSYRASRTRQDTQRGADAAVIANASLPIRRSKEGYLETIPDLIAELVSNDTPREVEAKVQDYLLAGVRVVWVADLGTRAVTAHRTGQLPQRL